MLDMCHFHSCRVFWGFLGFFLQGLQEQSLRYDKMLLGCSATGGFCNYHNRTHSVLSRCVVCCACTCENYSGHRVELVLTSSGLDLLTSVVAKTTTENQTCLIKNGWEKLCFYRSTGFGLDT